MEKAGVNLITGEGVSAIHPGDAEVSKLKVLTAKGSVIPSDLVILSMGVRVENKLAVDAGIKTGVRGSIVTDDCMHTSAPGVWAVGDMVETTNCITGGKTNLQLAVSTAACAPAMLMGAT